MLILNHVLLGKITVTMNKHWLVKTAWIWLKIHCQQAI